MAVSEYYNYIKEIDYNGSWSTMGMSASSRNLPQADKTTLLAQLMGTKLGVDAAKMRLFKQTEVPTLRPP
ncbi:hypothetical protein TSMEX_007017 [Taenia solium]|eukprot:TsM_001058900 transcript=TsM_001058900 gene=TsM_001058900